MREPGDEDDEELLEQQAQMQRGGAPPIPRPPPVAREAKPDRPTVHNYVRPTVTADEIEKGIADYCKLMGIPRHEPGRNGGRP